MSRVSTGDRAIAAQTVALGIRALSIGVAYIALGKVIGTGFDTSVDVRWVVVGVGALVVAALCDFANGLSQATSAGREEKRMRRALLAHAFGLGPARFSGHESGRLVSLMTDSVERVANYRQGYVGQLVGAILTPFITLVLIAIMIDWLTALILLACLPFVPLLIGVFQRRFRKDSARSRQVRGKLASQFLESIQNLPTLVGLRAADRVGTTLAKTGEENRVALMKVLARNQLLLFVTEAVFALFLVSVGFAAAWLRLRSGSIDLGEAVAAILLTTQLTTPITKVGGYFYIGMGGRAGQKAIAGFLKRRVPADSATPSCQGGSAVTMTDLEFGYNADTTVLESVDVEIAPGQRTVLVGPSGSGKSTLLSIMAGDLVPTGGSACVGGIALTSDHQDAIRRKSACVHQHTWLFHGTLAENLRVARPDATNDDMRRALERVDLGDWVASLPEGLDTHVGERGMSVSGGQAQRISLARAILADRELIILDEPTSQVDLESEQVIEKVIDELAEQATLIIATHRPALAKGQVYHVNNQNLEQTRAS